MSYRRKILRRHFDADAERRDGVARSTANRISAALAGVNVAATLHGVGMGLYLQSFRQRGRKWRTLYLLLASECAKAEKAAEPAEELAS